MSTRLLIQKQLAIKPMSSAQLLKALGGKYNTVFNAVTRMRDAQPRLLYIAGWTKGPGRPRPIYANGNLPDKPQPKPITIKEKDKRAWRSIKADPERYIRRLQAHRARALAKVEHRVDPIMAAFFGHATHQEGA